ncbi:MAG: group III truncated hemoglobin [Kordiimonadaceae bacterium]|nr:group III truncated hemoglobin [Kordiimonadaceae bacterium]MBO6568069.1 group III truncated hemoglobin [Kordiimonadaceae bacterium]MBO6964201.1 group III truncated hemoglobin [Kordiimonadaceae bacterium]
MTMVPDALIHEVVHSFYGRVRQHPVLAPVFNNVIQDWNPHLATMVDFWSSVMNTSGRYKGQPMPKHQALDGVSPYHFSVWLGLFEDTVLDLCEPSIAARFIEKSQMISRSLQLGMFGLPSLKSPAA